MVNVLLIKALLEYYIGPMNILYSWMQNKMQYYWEIRISMLIFDFSEEKFILREGSP